MTLKLDQSQNIVQMQRLVMLPQMQQALHVLQMPVMELATLVEATLAENPLVADEEQDEELEGLANEIEEPEIETDIKVEKELEFNDQDLKIMEHLDDELHSHFTEAGDYKPQRTKEEKERQEYAENTICAQPSLFEHLMSQARETFEKSEELAMAEALIGNFDARGFLQATWAELEFIYRYPVHRLREVLQQIQTFEPFGIGAISLQESLLIQLKCLGKQKKLAYCIIERHYGDFLHNRIPTIQKGLNCTSKEIADAIQHDIALLDLHPGAAFSPVIAVPIIPDVTVDLEGSDLRVKVNDDFMPSLRINAKYLTMLNDPEASEDTKVFIKSKLTALKWLLRNVHERHATLERITNFLCKHQKEFITDSNGKLIPMSMQQMAEELGLNESTITRAVGNKYLACPNGLIPFRAFFTSALKTNTGEDLSSEVVRKIMREMIGNEDKQKPLSDADLSELLKNQGVSCARRTVAKYRAELGLGNAQQRRRF